MARRTPRLLPPADIHAAGSSDLRCLSFARQLRHLMNERGMNQSDLARAIWGEVRTPEGRVAAKNRDRISVWLSGKTMPEPHNISALARALEVSEDDLMASQHMSAAIDHDAAATPEVQFTVAPGYPDKAVIKINKVLDFDDAMKILQLVRDIENKTGRRAMSGLAAQVDSARLGTEETRHD